jgi:glycosyltransferase involved in cell wall biosynthesis
MSDRVLVVVPIYNEETCIRELLKGIEDNFSSFISDKVYFLIINDGSTDDSMKFIIESEILSYINVKENKGIAQCINLGFTFARQNNYHTIAFFPGNSRIEVKSLINAIYNFKHENYSILIGSRFIEGAKCINVPLYKLLFIRMFSSFFSFLFKIKITDITCGLRIVNMKDWDNEIELVPNMSRYSGEQILCIKSIYKGIDIIEFPIYFEYNMKLRSYSHFSPKYYFQVIFPWFQYFFWKTLKINAIKPNWIKEL